MMLLDVNNLPREILLGYQNESNVNEIKIDCSAWMADYPAGLLTDTPVKGRSGA